MQLNLDYNAACQHISALTGKNPETAIVDIRLIHDARKDVPARHRRGTLRDHWNEIVNHQNDGYGVFININELDGKGRERENVAAIRAHAADLDNLSAPAQFALASVWTPPPAFAVATSPGKWHVYWPCEPYSDLQAAERRQRQLRQLFDGDRAVIDPTRVLRLAGTFHLKNPAAPHMVQFVPLTGQRTTPAALDAALAHVSVIEGGGGRHPLGDPAVPQLAAPSLDKLRRALAAIDPNDLDRGDWISTTAAFKQAGWNLASEPELRSMWDGWCARYAANDPAENDKQWRSIRETEVGWPAFLHRLPWLAFEDRRQQLPAPLPGGSVPAPQRMDYLDGFNPDTAGLTTTSAAALAKLVECRIPLAYDEFANIVMITSAVPWDKNGNYPRRWSDNDVVGCKIYLEAQHFMKPSKETVNDAAIFIAKQHRFHPVREYLRRKTWDGVARIEMLLPGYFGAVDDPYTRAIGRCFMIAAVARVMEPGCKVDTMLILEGAQGAGKSTAIRTLCGAEWFGDHLPDITKADAMLYLSGKWIVEIAELSAFNRAESNRIKSFASSAVDDFRAPYAKNNESHPRQSVFVGSTNDDGYLKDQTGNRRYWPVAVGQIDIAAIAHDRDQLWAEAHWLHLIGNRWWLTDGEEQLAAVEQDERREVDPWEERIGGFIGSLNGAAVPLEYVASVGLGLRLTEMNKATQMRIAASLKAAGYKRRRYTENGRRAWKYGPP